MPHLFTEAVKIPQISPESGLLLGKLNCKLKMVFSDYEQGAEDGDIVAMQPTGSYYSDGKRDDE